MGKRKINFVSSKKPIIIQQTEELKLKFVKNKWKLKYIQEQSWHRAQSTLF